MDTITGELTSTPPLTFIGNLNKPLTFLRTNRTITNVVRSEGSTKTKRTIHCPMLPMTQGIGAKIIYSDKSEDPCTLGMPLTTLAIYSKS